MSKESVIDEQTQTKKNDDELINENNDIEDNNDHNCDNTLQETVTNMNECETRNETKDFEEFSFPNNIYDPSR